MINSTYCVTVRGYELDSFGHLNNAVYLNYAEQAKWEFLNENNFLGTIRSSGLFPVVLENNIRYMNELRMFDKVRIETEWSCTRRVLLMKHVFFNDTTGKKACRITSKVMFTDENRMLYDLPDEMYSAIQEGRI